MALSSLLARFGRPRGAAAARLQAAAARIKARVAVRLDLDGAAAIAVNEILCPDPACPDLETVILVMAPGRPTRAVKVRKPMYEVSDDDVDAALAESGAP